MAKVEFNANELKKVKELLFPKLSNNSFDQDQIHNIYDMLGNYHNWLTSRKNTKEIFLNWKNPNNIPDITKILIDKKFANIKMVLECDDNLRKLFYHLTSSRFPTCIERELKSYIVSLAFKNNDEIIDIDFRPLVTNYDAGRFLDAASSARIIELRRANAADFIVYTAKYLGLLEKTINDNPQNYLLVNDAKKKLDTILSSLPNLLLTAYDELQPLLEKKKIANHYGIMLAINQLVDSLLTHKTISLLDFKSPLASPIINIAMKSNDTLAIIAKHYTLSDLSAAAKDSNVAILMNQLQTRIKLLQTKSRIDSAKNDNAIIINNNSNNIEIIDNSEPHQQAAMQLNNNDVNDFSPDCIIQSQIMDIKKYGFASNDQVELIMGNLTLLARQHAYKLDSVDATQRNEEENKLAISLKVVTQVINMLITIFGQSDFDKKTRNDFYKELINVLITLKISNPDPTFIGNVDKVIGKIAEQNQSIIELEVKRLNELERKELLPEQESNIQKNSFFHIKHAQDIRNVEDTNSIFYTFNI